MGGRAPGWLVAWLLVAAAGQVAGFELVRRVFLGTARGQLLDTAALDANMIGRRHIEGLVDTVLGAVTVLSVTAAVLVIGFIALLRGRMALAAAATLLVVGANVTTQLLKHLVERPDFGVDLERAVAGNSLPSGHATVAGSVAVALVLVLPAAGRGLAALFGAGYASVAGIATISADWHRPSDSVTALLVVGAWAAVAGLLLAVRRPVRPATRGPHPHRLALATLGLVGFAALAVAAVAMVLTDAALADGALASRVDLLSRGRLLVAYGGGAAGVTGVACLVTAVVLLTAHLLAPDRGGEPGPAGRLAAHPVPAPPTPVRRG
jgi:membrane-associated phospholipid phosphatase